MKLAAADAIAVAVRRRGAGARLHHPVGVRQARGRARGRAAADAAVRDGVCRRSDREADAPWRASTPSPSTSGTRWWPSDADGRHRQRRGPRLLSALRRCGPRSADTRWRAAIDAGGAGSTAAAGRRPSVHPCRGDRRRGRPARLGADAPTMRRRPGRGRSSGARTRSTSGRAERRRRLERLAGAGRAHRHHLRRGHDALAALRGYLDHHGLLGLLRPLVVLRRGRACTSPMPAIFDHALVGLGADPTRPAPRTWVTCVAPTWPGRGPWAGPRCATGAWPTTPGTGRRATTWWTTTPTCRRSPSDAGARTPPEPARTPRLPAACGSEVPETAGTPAGAGVPGGRDRRRSGDLPLFRRSLCQLSYPTGLRDDDPGGVDANVAVPTGFEPATSGLTGRRALQTAPRDHDLLKTASLC